MNSKIEDSKENLESINKMSDVMLEIMNEARDINRFVHEAHHSHYKTSKTGLIQPQEAPNANIIYHLFNDGSIEYTKGGDAYGQRSSFSLSNEVVNDYKHLFRFPKTGDTGYFYAILTEKECKTVRSRMETWAQKFREERKKTPNNGVLKTIMRLYGDSIYYKLTDCLLKGEKAICNTPPEFVHALRCINYGYDPDTTNDYGETLLMWAAASGCKPIVAILLGKADLFKTDKEGRTFLHYVNDPDLLHYIISGLPHKLLLTSNNTGNTPFHTAVLRQNYDIAQIYLDRAPELVNTRTLDNETALFYTATDKSSLAFTEKLISLGANKGIINTSGKTARDIAQEFKLDFWSIF